ncbi:XRE family transcriptional regulator [Arenibacter sp. TNZ]|uniref:helix-turn-helix domain-containing protein n=1 Tax=Arenibacter TaxID=178469 RepID=UPI000CD3CE00|nr:MULTISPECIES: helix-turn-helix transcriptional regulator [Arenibacter]MCM4170070.1 XRE family transcriptional regulator [Arenibacter sp. TNZ]
MELLRLKEILGKKGISGKDLAETVGVSPVSISNIVQGNSFPKPDLLLSIAKELEVDVRELFRPTKGGAIVNGFIEYEDEVYRVLSLADLEELIEKIKGN